MILADELFNGFWKVEFRGAGLLWLLWNLWVLRRLVCDRVPGIPRPGLDRTVDQQIAQLFPIRLEVLSALDLVRLVGGERTLR